MLFRPKKIDYTSPASAQGGPGIQKAVTWYVGTPYVNISTADWAGIVGATGATLGDTWWLGDGAQASGGNAFMFVKATAGLTLGQVVALAAPTATTAATGAGTAASPTTTTALVTTAYDNSATGTVNGEVDNWIFVHSAAATLPQMRRIKYNSVSTTSYYKVALPDNMRPNSPTDADVFDNVPLDTEPVAIIRPWNVRVCTNVLAPVGIALGTVTSGNYTIIQVAGLACVAASNSGAILVVDVPAIPIAGGLVTGGAGTANLYNGASSIIPQYPLNAAGPVIVPCYVNFLGQ